MKQINLTSIICSIILSISFILGCFIIRGSFEEEETKKEMKALMSIEETAEYLNLTELQVKQIISKEQEYLNLNQSFPGKMLPIIRINNENNISTEGLNEWLKEAINQRIDY